MEDVVVASDGEGGLPLTAFSAENDEAAFHFHVLKLTDQLYIWLGYNSARLGHLYASFPTSFDKTPSLATLIGGGADSVGASMARRLSLKTGWSIILGANLPSNSPTLEIWKQKFQQRGGGIRQHIKSTVTHIFAIEVSASYPLYGALALPLQRNSMQKGTELRNDLMSDESLTAAQKLGLRFHEDINKKIPRHEVKEMKTLVREVAESIEKNVIVVCGGSYRRGKDLVGDMDMVITHPDGKVGMNVSHVGFLRKLHQKLKEIDFLTEDLQLRLDHGPLETEKAVDTYFGLCKYPGREQRLRIDFKVYLYEKYPFGLIAWTGNDVLNRRLRILATSKGFRLDDQGCLPVMKDADGNEVANRSCSVP